jgi:hypothetical protein
MTQNEDSNTLTKDNLVDCMVAASGGAIRKTVEGNFVVSTPECVLSGTALSGNTVHITIEATAPLALQIAKDVGIITKMLTDDEGSE